MKKRREKNKIWENLQGFRYAHRGLFHQPLSASRKLSASVAKNPLRRQTDKVENALRRKAVSAKSTDSSRKMPASAAQVLWKEDIARWKAEGRGIVPENSMGAFRNAVRHGFGSELDVHLTADGKLVVLHDESLLRMTGVDAKAEEMTWPELSKLRLLNTGSRIPLLEQVLDLYTSGQALTGRRDARADRRGARLYLPLIIELKSEGNVRRLCHHVMELIDRYPTLNYCVESFDPRVVLWFRRHRSDVFRGQLTENFMRSREAVRQWGYVMTFGMWSVAPDLLTRPDFISCRFRDRRNLFIRFSHLCGVRQVNWIIRSQREMGIVDREGGLSIFERFLPDPD